MTFIKRNEISDWLFAILQRQSDAREPDWEQRRYELIRDFSSAMMANPKVLEIEGIGKYRSIDNYQKVAINNAINYEDELIRRLKNK